MKTPQEDYENKLQILKAPERKDFDKKHFFAEGDKMSRLEKYEHLDDKDVHNKPFIPPQGFKGPVAERVATDKQFVPLFIIIYFGLIIYAYFTMTQGVPDRLINGMDFRGQLCGIKALSTKPYLYYAGPVDDIQVAWCVHQCPPSSGRQTCMYDADHITITTFCYIQMQADKMSRYCIPKEPKSRTLVMEQLDSFRSVIRRIASDLWITWDITLASFAFCIVLSYLFTVLAKFENVIMPLIWGGIIGSVASFGIVAWMCWLEQQRIYNFRCIPGTDPSVCGGWPVTFFQVLTFIIAGVGGFYLIFIIVMIKRIKRGIELIKHAQRIVKVLGQIRMFPFIIAFVGLVVCSLAFILIVNAMTVGEIQLSRAKNIDGHLLYKIFYNDIIQYCIIFILFVVVFTLTLILVMNDMFTSYALSIWYFTKLKSTVHIPFLFSMKTLFRYHFGTCIFITCNLLFLTIPQSIMLYVRQLLRWLPQDSNVVRYCQACFMWCIHGFEIFLRYISKHSVVQVAIWSEPYYQSAKKAYFLIFRNRNKIKDLDTLQETIVFQLRLCTAMIACLPVYIYVSFAESTFMGLSTSDVETPIIPTFYVLFCGLFFTSVFQGSYDITCKTIIQLYLMDTEMFFGEQRFVEPFIKEFMEYVGKLEDDEWQVGFIRPIVFDKEKFNKKAKKIQEYNEKVKQGDADDIDAQSEEEEEDNQEKIEDYEVDYEDDKEPNYNPTIGLPTVKPSDSQFKRVDSDDLAGNLSQTMMQDLKPQGVFKQGPILNTSQQSFMIQVGNDKSMVSQISDVSEKPQQQQKIIKKQRI